MMRIKGIVGWSLVFLVWFAFLQTFGEYHYRFIEQWNLFLLTKQYMVGKLMQIGGLSYILSGLAGQLFVYPYIGALCIALCLTTVGISLYNVFRQIRPNSNNPFMYLFPPLLLMLLQFDFNYFFSGTIAYTAMTLLLWGSLRIRNVKYRLFVEIVSTPLFYFLFGPTACLYALIVGIYELTGHDRCYGGIIPLLLSVVCGLIAINGGYVGETRLAFLPDAYYRSGLSTQTLLYLPWGALVLFVLLTAVISRKSAGEPGLTKRKISLAVQFVLLCSVVYVGVLKYSDRRSTKVKELNYYMRTEQWDKIIDTSKGKMNNYLELCYLNMALLEQGQLADRMFSFDQKGIKGLNIGWNKSEHVSALISGMALAIGHIALSQEMAFESYVASMGDGNPYMLQRLVQTNLIYGEYGVAEKYIHLLSHTLNYKGWAENYRKFLYNDDRVEKDALLGNLRRCLPDTKLLCGTQAEATALCLIAEANPAHKAAIEYLGCSYLLEKDMDGFKKLIGKYYGTDVLPRLPKAFQEAVIVLFESNQSIWKQYDIDEAIAKRFVAFKKAILSNKRNKSMLPGLMRTSYGDTYWYYMMFK